MSGRLIGDIGIAAFFAAALRISIPVSLAALGEAVLERAGIVNVGLEGMMLIGAFIGFACASALDSTLLGGLLGSLAGGITGLGFAAMVARARAQEIVTGISLNLLALGSTAILIRRLYPSGAVPLIEPVESVRIPLLADTPILGPIFFDQSPYFFLLVTAAAILAVVLFKSRLGLQIEAAGRRPETLLLSGIRPCRVRMGAGLICGILAGSAGSQLALEGVSTFTEQATAGRGFVALAIVVVARRDPRLVPLVALLYGASEALALRLMTSGNFYSSALGELLPAVPFVLTLAVYAIASLSSIRRSAPA